MIIEKKTCYSHLLFSCQRATCFVELVEEDSLHDLGEVFVADSLGRGFLLRMRAERKVCLTPSPLPTEHTPPFETMHCQVPKRI